MWHFKYFTVIILLDFVHCAMEPFVIGGNETHINEYPHSVYLNILCKSSFICGGSILNQLVILTAGHCLEDCVKITENDVLIKYGHEHVHSMKSTQIRDFIVHENYDDDTMENDIALVLVKYPIMLGRGAQRVLLSQLMPRNIKLAYMAGWGFVNSREGTSVKLLDAVQELQPPNVCQLMGLLPPGTFCAGPIEGIGAPDRGDSGSALMARKIVQIGIVSYKVERYSLVVYTNVSYHYNWVIRNAVRLVCRSRRNLKK